MTSTGRGASQNITRSRSAALYRSRNVTPGDFAFSPDKPHHLRRGQPSRSPPRISNASSGIQRWDSNTLGGYTYNYTIQPMTGLTNGGLGLVVDFSANASWGSNSSGAKIYATDYGTSTNSLVSITDNGPASTPTILVTAGVNETLHGGAFSAR